MPSIATSVSGPFPDSLHGHLNQLVASLLLAVLALGLGLTMASLWIDASRWLGAGVSTTAPAPEPLATAASAGASLPLAADEVFDEVRYFEDCAR